ncbi:GNAT family N-acetyltransferase [Xanthovirga aplysinae]|uniref:GNAT family N-acetyltransferase n=1 Tax=Xanthovirga aplysinae TaxID=2529853 RepID=UPI0012BC1BD9|nr:GNAT family protein [Xanthovirga aplysinae]MTI31863.1 N-acetyltransferase [Xanthovirga aplysinae]
MKLTVREIEYHDIDLIVDYFLNSTAEYLRGMGADKNKLPTKMGWMEILRREYNKEEKDKEHYYIIWEIDSKPVGHCNINKITFGKEAFMHLHLWKSDRRRKGIGFEFLKQTIPFYFRNFKLKALVCEPFALNPAPNKILPKLGFEFEKTYETTPGWINFHQKVNRYILTLKRFKAGFNNPKSDTV